MFKVRLDPKAQSISEYVIVIMIVTAALSGMAIYMKRGIQAAIKTVADEIGDQRDSEEIDPLKGVKSSGNMRRDSSSTYKITAKSGGAIEYSTDSVSDSSGSTVYKSEGED